MDKWFDDKLNTNRLRNYTRNQIDKEFIKSTNSISRSFSLTTWFIILNTIVFVIISLYISFFKSEDIFRYFAIQPKAFFSGEVWILLTGMFMHANLTHLLVNMISLFFIGNFVEKLIGRKRYFWFYLISGVISGLFFVTLSYFFGTTFLGEKIFGAPSVFAVGASGAIFALLGILSILTPYNKIYLIAGPLIAIIIEAIFHSVSPQSSLLPVIDLIVTLYFIFSLLAIFSFNQNIRRLAFPIEMPLWLLPIVAIVPLVIIGLFVELPIGNSAHLGGLLVGIVYAIYLKKKYRRKTALIQKFFR